MICETPLRDVRNVQQTVYGRLFLYSWTFGAHDGGREDGHGSGLCEVVQRERRELVHRRRKGAESSVVVCNLESFRAGMVNEFRI